jgi:hypothetical protein
MRLTPAASPSQPTSAKWERGEPCASSSSCCNRSCKMRDVVRLYQPPPLAARLRPRPPPAAARLHTFVSLHGAVAAPISAATSSLTDPGPTYLLSSRYPGPVVAPSPPMHHPSGELLADGGGGDEVAAADPRARWTTTRSGSDPAAAASSDAGRAPAPARGCALAHPRGGGAGRWRIPCSSSALHPVL